VSIVENREKIDLKKVQAPQGCQKSEERKLRILPARAAGGKNKCRSDAKPAKTRRAVTHTCKGPCDDPRRKVIKTGPKTAGRVE